MGTRTVPVLAILAVVLVVLALIIFAGPSLAPPGQGAGSGPVRLAAVEVRSYEGKPLSSVTDFHENSIAGPQHVNISSWHLSITGLVSRPRSLSYDEILAQNPHYSKVVTLHCVEGWDATILWEGVLVRDLIGPAGPAPRANTVIFTAHDGYTTSFPLAYFSDRDILLAYRMNNITMPAERGYPFALVAEDKWGYKWIKWVEKIELSDDPSYRGFWESRGYSNAGDLNGSMFERGT